MSLKDWKFFVVNRGKGVIDENNPISSSNLVRTEKPLIETDPTVPNWVKEITQDDISEWVEGFNNNIISGSITGDSDKTVTLTKRNGTTIQFSFSDNEGVNADDVINSLSFDDTNGVLTAITSEGIEITTTIDGRYALIGHSHSWEEIDNKPSTYPPESHSHNYDNFGGWNIQVNGEASTQIASNETLNITGSGATTVSRSGNTITVDSTGGSMIEGTIIVTSSRTLQTSDNQKTLICRNNSSDITLTIPTGLGNDFTCNFVSEDSGDRYTEIIAGSGFNLKAPHGTKLLTDYTANLIKRTGEEIGNLQGELTP